MPLTSNVDSDLKFSSYWGLWVSLIKVGVPYMRPKFPKKWVFVATRFKLSI